MSEQEEYIPICPDCGANMVLRENRKNHRRFWGCSTWPKCHGSLSLQAGEYQGYRELVRKEHRLKWSENFRNKLAEKRPVHYQEYIRSRKWRAKAIRAKQEARYTCQICNSPVQLEAHHRTYRRLGYEMPQDITILCDECHELFSKNGKLKS